MVKSVAISLRGLMGCRRKADPAGFLVGDLGEFAACYPQRYPPRNFPPLFS